jgi:hypothetical protein
MIFIPLIFVACFLAGLPVFGQEIKPNIQPSPSQIPAGDPSQIDATVNDSPGTLGTFHLFLDKSVYAPGETVMIHVVDTSSNTNTPVFLKILDASSDIKGITTIYEDTQSISNGSATFNYTIPKETDTQTLYRYLVQVYQNQQDCCPAGSAYFVTDPDANLIQISNVQVSSLNVSPGQTINFTALVRDGLGNTVRNLDFQADMPQTSGANYLSGNATFDNSTKLYMGEIPVPKSFGSSNLPLQYYLRVTVQGPEGAGLTPLEYRGGIVNIVPSAIPEFPIAILVLFASVALVIGFNKIRK